MCKVPTLKQLAAEAVPQDVILTNLHKDVATIIEYNKLKVKTCTHKTTWTCRRNEVNGAVAFTCGCVEQWKNDEYVKDVADCDSIVCRRVRVWRVGCACV